MFENHLVVVLIAVAVLVCLTAVTESVFTRLADIVRAAGATVADIINAWAHGRAVVADAKTRRNLFAQAAKQPDKVSEFERLIRLQPTNANLPMDRRMSDDHIARIAAPPKPRTKSRPGGEPEPGGKPEPGGQLLHLRQSPDE